MSTIEHDIEEAREHLGETVEALSSKAETGKRRLGIAALAGAVAVAALVLWRRLG